LATLLRPTNVDVYVVVDVVADADADVKREDVAVRRKTQIDLTKSGKIASDLAILTV
jgi:hypothetical protein